MRYLIQHKKEFAISIGVFVMTLINLIRAIMAKEVTQECIVAFVLAFFTVLGWYYNMPTSEENCEHTGEMRQEKAEKAGTVSGEYFYSDSYDEIFDEAELDETITINEDYTEEVSDGEQQDL